MSVKYYLKELKTMDEKTALAYLDELAAEMRDRVINTPSDYYASGRIIYVSADGDDSNDGLSEQTPIKSIAKIEEMMIDNDTFLLRRGDMFRGSILVDKKNITFSAYGTGNKPIFNSSLRDYADPEIWEKTEWENVWKCTIPLKNVGIVHYNTLRTYGNYSETTGIMMVLGRTPDFTGPCDMKEEYTFYSDLATSQLYLYAPGNPGEIYDSLEIGTRVNTIRGSASHLTVDNLHIQHCGAHGVQDIIGDHLTVKNCIFDWLGGSILEGYAGGNTVRYGNAIEVGRCNGYLVKNNWMYQIYDTGITHQTGSGATVDVHQYDVLYLDNLVEYCYWSLEFYNAAVQGTEHDIRNVYMTGNFCRFGGFGWGCRGREDGAPMVSSASCCPDTRDFTLENNIFDRCTGVLVSLWDEPGNRNIKFRSNVYIQPKDARFLNIFKKVYNFTDDREQIIADVLGDTTATVYTLSDWHVQKQWSGRKE